jgi:FtsP/CotA-like multicopper oxidase with cupredoxin domain
MTLKPLAARQGWALALLPLSLACADAMAQAVPGGTLDPNTIPKYVTPLVIPPVLYDDLGGTVPLDVEVALRQFDQQQLPTTGCDPALYACVDNGDGTFAFPKTTLWGYGNPADAATFNNPAFTIEVTCTGALPGCAPEGTMTTVKWINDLVEGGAYLPHIIQDAAGNPIIDQTLHWAAPNQDCRNGVTGPDGDTDCRGASDQPYTGPIPMVVHVHGAHVGPGSDGYPEAWWLPSSAAGIDCTNVIGYPATPDTADDFDCNGTFFESAEGADTDAALGQGYAIDMYPNDQPTTTLWYHDHSLGITRLNVYAASAGFWLIRDANDGETGLLSGVLPGPAPAAGEDPNGDPAVRAKIREIPIAIQPKSFNADGSQYYPAARAFFEGLGLGDTFADNTGINMPFLPQGTSDIAPVWNPEAFFNTMVVNGSTWPVYEVAPERYRLRFVNAADSRFLNLSLYTLKNNGNQDEELPFYQIGSDQSLLPQVVQIETGFATPLVTGAPLPKNPSQKVKGTFKEQALLIGPAERADVIVDFTGLPDGTIVRMFNTAPDAPFGGFPDVPADPATTGQVMQFVINSTLANPTGDPSTPVNLLAFDANPGGVPKLGVSNATRDLALLEEESALLCVTVDAKTGVIDLVPNSVPPLCAGGGVPFGPKEAVLGVAGSAGGQVQLWDDPIAQNPQVDATETWELWNWSADGHPIHLHLVKFEVVNREIIGGAVRPAEPWEAGYKDTVIAYPGEVTRVKAKFDIPGLYVWHCHILSHEDNEMMVPYCVGQAGTDCPAELF